MVVDWGAMAARENRATDRERVRLLAQKPENRGKRKFRKGKKRRGGRRSVRPIPTIQEADRIVAAFGSRARDKMTLSGNAPGEGPGSMGVPPNQAIGGGLSGLERGLKAKIESEAVPLIGGGVRSQAAAGILRNLPGIGRYLGRTDAGLGGMIAGQFPRIGRALPWLAGISGGVALEKIADYGLERLGEPGRPSRGPGPIGVIPSGGKSLMQQQGPLGTLSRGQEFPGGPFVVKTWDTYPGPGVTGGGAWPIFALLSDGRIVVSKPNGSWKVYRPKKNLVISSNPRLRDVRKLDRMHKKVTGMMRRMVPKTVRRK